MAGWLTPRRRNDPELMDAPGLPPEEVADAYRTLRRVNRQLGNLRTIGLEARRLAAEDDAEAGTPLHVLDVGSGSGDLARAVSDVLRSQGRSGRVVALDLDPTALALAGRNGLEPVRADVRRLPFRDRSFDLVTAVKFAHHFEGAALARLLGEITRVARRRVLVLDIHRHWMAYAGFVAWSRAFTRNRLVRHDGPLSVLRGFTPGELLALTPTLTDYHWTVRSRPGFQLLLTGDRRD